MKKELSLKGMLNPTLKYGPVAIPVTSVSESEELSLYPELE